MKMNKFQAKAFECELLGDIYQSLEARKDYYRHYNSETDSWENPTEMYEIERLAIIDELMKKIEKMV